MKPLVSSRTWKYLLVPAGLAGTLVAILAAGRTPAFGGAALQGATLDTAPVVAAEPSVVLVGGYSCALSTYTIVQPPTVPPPDDPVPPAGERSGAATLDETETYTDLSHNVYVNGTGGVIPPSGAAPPSPPPVVGVGPGFGGRGPIRFGQVGAAAIPMVTSGMGTGGSFNRGTIDDCRRFAEAVLATTRSQGCVASDITQRSSFPSTYFQQEILSFNFVCEGPASAEIHFIGELNRTVVRQTIEPAP